MDYEQIRKKYGEAARERRRAIKAFDTRIEFAKAMRENYVTIRDQFRGGRLCAERVKEFQRLSDKVMEMDRKIRDLEYEKARFEIGDDKDKINV